MNKNKLIELRCKAWGITEDEYYCNQCSDFSLEDMARAYRRGKNKGRAALEKENAELKEVHESDKRSLALIAKKGADFEKAYNEAEELLDKQIEATYKLFEENKELKAQLESERDLPAIAYMQGAENQKKKADKQLTYAKTIIQDLLDNTDEYARQRAEDFLKENK